MYINMNVYGFYFVHALLTLVLVGRSRLKNIFDP